MKNQLNFPFYLNRFLLHRKTINFIITQDSIYSDEILCYSHMSCLRFHTEVLYKIMCTQINLICFIWGFCL